MTELQKYLVEEIALDHADGLISRREALRRLALVGIGVSAATSLLAALAAGQARAGWRTRTVDGHDQADGRRRDHADHVRRPGGRTLTGAWARGDSRAAACSSSTRTAASPTTSARSPAASPRRLLRPRRRPALRGGRHGDVRRRGAGDGRARAGPDPSASSPTCRRASTSCSGGCPARSRRDRLLLRRRHGLAPARRRRAAAGGGGAVLRPVPGGADFAGPNAAVLGIYGGSTRGSTPREPPPQAALDEGRSDARARVFPGVDHAFFNDTGPRYNRTRGRGRTSACSTGSAATPASPSARRRACPRPTRRPTPRRAGRGSGARRRRRAQREAREPLGARVEADERVGAEVGQPDVVALVDVDGVGLRRRRPAASTRASVRSPGRTRPTWPAFHSLTQIRPCESDQTRRAPWSGVGGSMPRRAAGRASRCGRCGCRRATRSRPRRAASSVMPYGPAPRGASQTRTFPARRVEPAVDAALPGEPEHAAPVEDGGVEVGVGRRRGQREAAAPRASPGRRARSRSARRR